MKSIERQLEEVLATQRKLKAQVEQLAAVLKRKDPERYAQWEKERNERTH